MTIKKMMTSSPQKIQVSSFYGANVKAPITGIVDIDDSSMYAQMHGIPVLFTNQGNFKLDEDLMSKVKGFVTETNLETKLESLPEDLQQLITKLPRWE